MAQSAEPSGPTMQGSSQNIAGEGSPKSVGLEDTERFIMSHSSTGQNYEFFGTMQGDVTGRIKGSWTWRGYEYSGCAPTLMYSNEVLWYESDPNKPFGQTIRSSSPDRPTTLSKFDPNEVRIYRESADEQQSFREDGKQVTVTSTSEVYKIGVKYSITGPVWTAPARGLDFDLRDPAQVERNQKLHPEDYQTKTRTAETVFFVTPDELLAERMVKAVAHTIELCGGKTQAF
jgi:hypothetical protein